MDYVFVNVIVSLCLLISPISTDYTLYPSSNITAPTAIRLSSLSTKVTNDDSTNQVIIPFFTIPNDNAWNIRSLDLPLAAGIGHPSNVRVRFVKGVVFNTENVVFDATINTSGPAPVFTVFPLSNLYTLEFGSMGPYLYNDTYWVWLTSNGQAEPAYSIASMSPTSIFISYCGVNSENDCYALNNSNAMLPSVQLQKGVYEEWSAPSFAGTTLFQINGYPIGSCCNNENMCIPNVSQVNCDSIIQVFHNNLTYCDDPNACIPPSASPSASSGQTVTATKTPSATSSHSASRSKSPSMKPSSSPMPSHQSSEVSSVERVSSFFKIWTGLLSGN